MIKLLSIIIKKNLKKHTKRNKNILEIYQQNILKKHEKHKKNMYILEI